MIELYGGQTPNVFKPLIMLEELGLNYVRKPLDIMKGEQFDPAYLALNPNNKVPAMVDTAPADGGAPIALMESGAMLLYLAEKGGSLLPADPRGRANVVQWLMWQMAGQGPMLGQLGHFRNYAPEKLPYAVNRYSNEAKRLYAVLDHALDGNAFVAGEYSIADIACWPWIIFRRHHEIDLADYPHVGRWYEMIAKRPAVVRALGDFEAPPPPVMTEEERAILFGRKE